MVKYFKGRDPLMKDLERDANVESDCEPIEPVVPIIAPQEVDPVPVSRKPRRKGPQPAQPQAPTKSGWGWDKMALEITDPRPPQHAPPPVIEPSFASWGGPGPVSPTLSQRKPHTPLVSIYES